MRGLSHGFSDGFAECLVERGRGSAAFLVRLERIVLPAGAVREAQACPVPGDP